MGAIRDEDFLALWREHGADLSWRDYARRLSLMTDQDISEAYVRVWAGRNRDRLEARYGVILPPRRISAAAEFDAWPQLPTELRHRTFYRVLQYHARAKIEGADSLSLPNRAVYLRVRDDLMNADEVIRYDVGYGLYSDKRTPEEAAADPNYERLSETRESYEARQAHPRRRW